MKNEYNSKVIIACDFNTKKELFYFLSNFKKDKLFLKLGMQLLYNEGFNIINELKELGHNIFIDLKIIDIPNTMKYAIKSLLKYNPDFISIHSFCGRKSMELVQSLIKKTNTKILAITILTSTTDADLMDFGININIKKYLDILLNLISESKIWGVVCSPHEAKLVNSKGLIAITPGIRWKNDNSDDQKRIMTPRDAIINGSNFLVIGRSITKSDNPQKTYQKILNDIKI